MTNRRVRVNGQFVPEWGDVVFRDDGIWKVLKPDIGKFLRSNGVNTAPTWEPAGGGGSATWGAITGLLANQTDLDTALNGKQATLGFTPENVANKDTDGTLSANSDTKYASQKATKTYADTKQSALGFTPENVANKDTDVALTANSDTRYPSQKAIKAYADTKQTALGFTPENVANKDTDVTLSANSDTKYASQKAVKAYVDGLVANAVRLIGGWDASVNLFPATGGSGVAGAILKGDSWIITVAGTLGGQSVIAGDTILAIVNTPAQTSANWNILDTNISYVPEDVANKDTDGTLSTNSDTRYPSQKAVKTYADTKQTALGFTPENVANKDTDGTLTANSDTKYPSQKAVKTYADTKQSALGFTPENVANKDTDVALTANSDTRYASQKAIKTYVDAKVIDSIADSDTTHAPSRNAVFDALALKAVDANVVHTTGDENVGGVKNFTSVTSFSDGAVSTPSIAHAGDLNTGFYFPSADTIAVVANGAEAMRVTSTGNVGIGDTAPDNNSPYTTLSVKGKNNASGGLLDLKTLDSSVWLQIYTDSGGSHMVGRTAHPLTLHTNTTERLRIESGGNIGIDGITSPASKLNLNVGTTFDKGLLFGASGAGLSVWHDNSGLTTSYIESRYDDAGSVMKFRTRANGTPITALEIAGTGISTFKKAVRASETSLSSSSGAVAIDFSSSNDFTHTMTENTTLSAPSNAVAGQSGSIRITQHASSPKTLAYNTAWKFEGGSIPVLTATNGASDTLYYAVRSSTFIECRLGKGYA